ncbi:helix-turn-helix domain-containing protein [Paenibacillus aceris]|uniref:AraC-like DNA-binding protein n=1 Tax=Paenibacillus aceris TaxID=869555 RepID=A0ABS4I5R7_9BACL|nr:helix-turn-helix domain-containing protein [Paenibacillus aceris]MBP1965454.1 AraC-like DNA-binding protein [Paenibacillus aceris]NHW33496.1 helix-turn-helix transcriptional regulator [Paenibacillus aceris]
MHKYLLRLLGFSLILGALPTVFIGIASYYIATQDVEAKVNEANMQLLLQKQLRVEQTVKSLEVTSLQFINSALVKEVMNESLTGDDFIRVREVMTGLYNLQAKAVISEAYLVNLEKGWAVTLDKLKQVDRLENKNELMLYAKQPESLFWNTHLLNQVQSTGGDAQGDGQETGPANTLSLIYKIPIVPKTNSPKGMLVVQVSTDEIRGGLASNNQLGTNYVLDQKGNAFLSTPEDQAAFREINTIITNKISGDTDKRGFFKAKVGEEQVGVSYLSSGYNAWTFVSVVSISEMTQASKKIGLLTAAACALILLIVLAFAFYGSKRMYSPIRNLLEVTSSYEVEPTANNHTARRDELAYIQEKFQSLAVSRGRLEKQMQGQSVHLKEFFVLKLFTGQISDEDFTHRSQMYGFPTEWSSLGVLTLQVDQLQETRYQEQDRELLLFAINNIVGELLPVHTRFSPILLGESQVTLLSLDTTDPEELKLKFYQTAELIKSTVGKYLQLQVSVGISKPYHKLSETVKAYGESLVALKCRISLGPDIIVHFEDIESSERAESAVYSHLKLMEDQLLQALKDVQLDKAMEVFQTYLSTLLNKDGFLHEHHILLLQLMSRILTVVQDQGISVKKVLDGDSAVERLLKLQTRDDIAIWFQTRLFAPIIVILSEKADSQYLNIADRLVRIIHDQYDQDITLESCAAALNFHPVYLSRVFKREMGIPFSDYLSDYRMNMAKVMLETTTLKISEIGEKLQYKNISAFIRNFRKTFGMTPGSYRELFDSNK